MRTKILGVVLMSLCFSSYAQPSQSLDELKSLAKHYLSHAMGQLTDAKIDVQVGYLDPRLRLSPCPKALLEVFLPPGNKPMNTNTVGLRCNSARPWSVYIPVKTAVFANVVMAVRPLYRGQMIQSADLTQQAIAINRLQNGYFRDRQAVIGKVVEKSIQPGEPLTPRHLALPKVLKKGQKVQIIAQFAGVKVTSSGTAMSDGSRGETVKIQTNHKVIDAQVQTTDRVEVIL